MSIKYSNNAATTVATSFSNSATALVVADASEFPTLTGSDELRITLSDVTNTVFEIVTCTAIAGTTLTVVRAQENTTAAAWAIGTDVSLRITAAGLEAKADKTQVLTNVPAGALFTDTNTVYSLPTQASNANKFLKTDGSNESWAVVEALPSQSGNTGKFLTTDGSAATWATQAVTLANYYTKAQTDNLIRFEIDGGVSNSTYLATQLVDGGTA